MNKNELKKKLKLLRELKIRQARKSFWEFCKLQASDFYKEEREYLKILCNTLEDLYYGRLKRSDGFVYRRLALSIGPRHGKSRTLTLFTMWALGIDNTNRVITCSYNDDLATSFSRACRDGIQQERGKESDIIYNDIFPETKIKYGDASYKKWALEGQFFSYKGTGIGAGVTGSGCNISIADDTVKDSSVAFNDRELQKIYDWYCNTFMSRREQEKYDTNGNIIRPSIEIICMTRWSKKDLIGRFLDGEEADEWYVLNMPVYNEETDEMLCEEVLSKERYLSLKRNLDPAIFNSNYQQKPIDVSGSLYKKFLTYTSLPTDDEGNTVYDKHFAYIDTADKGTDSLVAITGYKYNDDFYVKDIYTSREDMSITQKEVADFIELNKPDDCIIESNNGGHAFTLLLEQELKRRGYTYTSFEDRAQTKNKETRILVNSAYVQNHIYYPIGFERKYKDYYIEVTSYSKDKRNEHDDCVDCITAIAEEIQANNEVNIREI